MSEATTAIPVTEQFWQELANFLSDHFISISDLTKAGISYGTARKIVNGEQQSKICKESHMRIFKKILQDPAKFRQGRPTHAVQSLEDLMSMSMGDE